MTNLNALDQKNPLFALELRSQEKVDIPFSDFKVPKEETFALYLYSLGSKKWQEKVLKWLENETGRQIFILPEDLQILHGLILPLMEHPRVLITSDFRPLVWKHLFKPWEVMGGEKAPIGEAVLGAELTLALYQDFGVSLLTNVFKNLSLDQTVKKGASLEGKFKGIPAVICGAGPSLQESLPELEAIQDRALIIGGGSALGPLSRAHIPIHFSAAIDPDPPTERFYRQNHFEAPLFYQNQVSHTLLKHHHGEKFCLGQSGSFPLEEYLTDGLDIPPCDVGWNVTTFSVMVAALLGCDPIYFVGLDLCVYEEESYASGVEGIDERHNPIELKDKFGKEVLTRPDFLMSKKWIEDFARQHVEKTFINASKRGLELEGIMEGPLMMVSKKIDLSAKVHKSVICAQEIHFSSLSEKFKALDESLKKTHVILNEQMSALEKKENTALFDYELEQELFYHYHLEPVWHVWKNLLQTDEIVQRMNDQEYEKKLQQTLFFQDVTLKVCHARNLSV